MSQKMQNSDLKVDDAKAIIKSQEVLRQVLGLIYSLGLSEEVLYRLLKNRQQR
jgi:hypothetical protein